MTLRPKARLIARRGEVMPHKRLKLMAVLVIGILLLTSLIAYNLILKSDDAIIKRVKESPTTAQDIAHYFSNQPAGIYHFDFWGRIFRYSSGGNKDYITIDSAVLQKIRLFKIKQINVFDNHTDMIIFSTWGYSKGLLVWNEDYSIYKYHDIEQGYIYEWFLIRDNIYFYKSR